MIKNGFFALFFTIAYIKNKHEKEVIKMGDKNPKKLKKKKAVKVVAEPIVDNEKPKERRLKNEKKRD